MTRITFLGHSGFLAETEEACLLFDWWKGELPALPAKPLFVFASHRHPDHFDRRIFAREGDVTFVLSSDIRISEARREKWGLSPAVMERCVSAAPGCVLSLAGLTVETLPSTDEGVAFVVTAAGRTFYHAGDLNWWHWAEEEAGRNRNMEVCFKRFLEPLRGRRLDFAFAPLDPRLGDAEDWGFCYLLETARVGRIFPMHQWEDPSPTARFRAAHPSLSGAVVPVDAPGQQWTFCD